MLKGFKQFNEAKVKEVTFTFGRFNPPTTGHGKLITKVAASAIGNSYRIYASHSNNPKKDPLEYKEKIKVMRKMFPKHGRNIIEDKNAKTVFHIATALYLEGFTKIKMVVGSDRVSEFQKLLKKYNGVKGKHGFYDFVDGIQIVSAGDRDPDAEGVSGMSASKMRQAAIDGDFKQFMVGIPKAYGEGMTLFNLVRKRMGLKEMTSFRQHIQLPTISDKREKYISGEIFKEGSTAYVNGEVEIVIKQRKSNYVISDENDKYFIHNLEESKMTSKQDKDIKDRPGTQPAAYYDKPGKKLSKSTKAARARHFEKGAKKDDDDPSAYKPAPGDAQAKTKPSKHTKKFKQMFGEFLEDKHSGPCWKTHKMVGMKKKKGYPGLVPNCVPREEVEVDEAEKRIARKKGQHKGSSSHSDLYTDEDPKGTIHGLGFKDAATANKSIAIINKSDRTHAHKVQATLVMQQRSKVAIGRTKDPEKKKNLEAANKIYTAHLEKLKKITKQKNEYYEIGNSFADYAKDLTPNEVKEKLDPKKDDVGDYIDDFMKSDAPQFKGKSKEKIRKMAIAAYLDAKETVEEGTGKRKGESWEDGFKRRVVKTTKPEHLEKGFKWRIKGKERNEISIKLYKKKPDFAEFKKQMKRVAGHEFGG